MLRGMGIAHQQEVATPDGLFSLDIVAQASTLLASLGQPLTCVDYESQAAEGTWSPSCVFHGVPCMHQPRHITACMRTSDTMSGLFSAWFSCRSYKRKMYDSDTSAFALHVPAHPAVQAGKSEASAAWYSCRFSPRPGLTAMLETLIPGASLTPW